MRTLLTALMGMAVAACASPPEKVAQAGAEFGYVNQQLAVKTMFARQQEAAIAEPFVGVRTNKGLQTGLFPVRATGVSTEPVRQAANDFL
ncbi:MAG: hypothetical protein Q8R82_20900, partial [Hyphomonadaceae bacterium]|nr:hypothetical protein [Hyphomonadaceae bacterium]